MTTGGFSFGSGAAAAKPATAGFSFGQTPGTTTGQSAFSFGQTTAAQPAAFNFGGAKTTANTSFALGTAQKTATVTPAANLGAASTFAAPSGLTTSTPASLTGFNFSSLSTAQPNAMLKTGLTTQAQAPTLGSTTSAFNLGAKSAAAPSAFQFGGLTTSTATAAAPGAGTGLLGATGTTNLFGAKTTASATGAFGAQPVATGLLGAKTTTTTGLLGTTTGMFGATGGLTGGLGTAATGLGGTGSAFGGLGTALSGTATTTTGTLGGLGGTVAGLGGSTLTATSAVTNGKQGINGTKSDSKQLKENALPNQMNLTVEELKKYIKEQKSLRDEITRISGGGFEKVHEEMTALRQQLSVVSNGIQRDGFAVEKLKHEMSQELRNAEISQRINDIPLALQHEYTAPSEYFYRIVVSFEERMLLYRQQIEELESHLVSMGQHHAFTPQELAEVMRRLHDTFIALAAQLQNIHEQVKAQKEHYMKYRKAFFSDSADPFSQTANGTNSSAVSAVSVGPSPFSNITGAIMAAALNASNLGANGILPQTTGLATAQPQTLGNNLNLAKGFGNTGVATGGLGAGTTGFGSLGTSAFGSGLGTNTAGFGGIGTATTGFGTSLGTTNTGFGTTGTSAFGQTGTAGFGTTSTLGGFGNTTSGTTGFNFGTPTAGTTTFQLNKPPAGNKRGKKK